MSGPKVIRIVTREEVIAICQRHLSQLDAAIAEWTRVCERSGTMDASAAAAIAQRRSALQHLLTTDRFLDLQKQVPTEISYLQSDAEARIARAADAAAQALQQRRRMASTARMLLEELGRSGRPIPEDLQRDLRSAQPEEAVSRALQLLAPPSKSTAPSERQRQLASRLRGPGGACPARFGRCSRAHRAHRAAIAQGDLSSAPALLAQAAAFEQERLRLVAAEARRRAVLLQLRGRPRHRAGSRPGRQEDSGTSEPEGRARLLPG